MNFPEFRNWFAEPPQYDTDHPAPSLNADTRALVLENTILAIEQCYLDPDSGARLIRDFRQHISTGVYAEITDGRALAAAITSDLQYLSGDKHFRCLYGIKPDEPGHEEQISRLEKLNHGFGQVVMLDGNIALLEIRGFVPVHWEGVRRKIDEMMSSISSADALILDLRYNRGGDPKAVALVAGYLLGEPTIWLRMVKPSDESVEDIPTDLPVKEKRFGLDKPVYVLTSSNTISGGEDLAYGLQALQRAVVVGEKTAGAANLPRACALNDLFVLFTPHMCPVHPVAGGNWEGEGVTPDIVVAEDALETAYNLAKEKLGLSL